MPVPAVIPPEAFSCTRSQHADTESPDPQFLAGLHTNPYELHQSDTYRNLFPESFDDSGGIDGNRKRPK